METDSGRNRVLCAIAGTVVRPNATFRTISDFPARYSVSSVVIFAAVCIVSFQSPAIAWLESDGSALGDSALPYVRSFIHSAFPNFIFIAVLFWIGGKYGEHRRFKDAFPVLSYCLIPIVFLAVISLGIHLLGMQAFMHNDGYWVGGSLDQDPDLSPSYALEFAGFAGVVLIRTAFMAFFMVWVFVLFVKAMKISHGFGTGKAVGVVALAAAVTYFVTMTFAILQIIFVPFAWI